MTQARGLPLDEGGVLAGHFHAIDPSGAAGCELEGDGAGAPEQVQDLQAFQFVFVVQDVEKTLPGEIRRGPGLVAGGRIDALPLETAPDDPHIRSTDLK